jgi:hypothetical protein
MHKIEQGNIFRVLDTDTVKSGEKLSTLSTIGKYEPFKRFRKLNLKIHTLSTYYAQEGVPVLKRKRLFICLRRTSFAHLFHDCNGAPRDNAMVSWSRV